MRGVWKFSIEMNGELCVMTSLDKKKHKSFADNFHSMGMRYAKAE